MLDNTLETFKNNAEVEDKPKRTIIRPELNKESNMTEEALIDYWCYTINIMNATEMHFTG